MKRGHFGICALSIQILQYEFLGPIPLEDWGPPMEKLIYLILSRDKDRFNIVYVGDCEKTDEETFFTGHPKYGCWTANSDSAKSLHLAILPMFESSSQSRKNAFNKIVAHYRPVCNSDDVKETKPAYAVRKSQNTAPESGKISCPCCGARMNPEKTLEKSTLFRCTSCGMSDTRLD